jgi:hypothetical protein
LATIFTIIGNCTFEAPANTLSPRDWRERQNPFHPEVDVFSNLGRPETASQPSPESASEPSWSPRYFLAQNSALWGFARAIKNKLFGPRKASWKIFSGNFRTAVEALTPRQLEYASDFEGPDWKTIFTSRYREAVVNADDPRIGVRIWLTKWGIQYIDQMAKQSGVEDFTSNERERLCRQGEGRRRPQIFSGAHD